jgi:hypothetical protein
VLEVKALNPCPFHEGQGFFFERGGQIYFFSFENKPSGTFPKFRYRPGIVFHYIPHSLIEAQSAATVTPFFKSPFGGSGNTAISAKHGLPPCHGPMRQTIDNPASLVYVCVKK